VPQPFDAVGDPGTEFGSAGFLERGDKDVRNAAAIWAPDFAMKQGQMGFFARIEVNSFDSVYSACTEPIRRTASLVDRPTEFKIGYPFGVFDDMS